MDEEYTYENEVDNNLQCPICRNAFIEPTMSGACQHVFCLDCISTALSLSPTCPIDRSRLSRDDLVPAPRIIQQMVQELRVLCPYAKHGCAVVCERSLLPNHLKRECKHKGKGKELVQDPAGEDDEAVQRCAECDELVKLSQSSLHPETCPALPTICEYCSDQILHRSSLPAHLLLCPIIPIPCPHASHGCTARLPRHQMVEEHLEIACPYEPIKECLSRYDGRIFEVESENFALRKRVGGLENGMEEMRGLLEGIKAGMGTYFVEPTRNTDRTRLSNGTGRLAVDRITPLPLTSSPSVHDDQYLEEFYDEFVAPIHPTSTAPSLPTQSTSHTTPSLLTTTLDSISTSLASLRQELSNVESRRNEDLVIADELRGQFVEELGSIKSVVHGMRMQMHHLLMEFTRMTGGRGGMFTGGMNQQQGGGGGQQGDLRFRDRGSEGSNSDEDSPNLLPHLSLPVQPNSRIFFQPPPVPIYGTSGSSSGSNYSNAGGGGLGMGMMPRRFSQQETKL